MSSSKAADCPPSAWCRARTPHPQSPGWNHPKPHPRPSLVLRQLIKCQTPTDGKGPGPPRLEISPQTPLLFVANACPLPLFIQQVPPSKLVQVKRVQSPRERHTEPQSSPFAFWLPISLPLKSQLEAHLILPSSAMFHSIPPLFRFKVRQVVKGVVNSPNPLCWSLGHKRRCFEHQMHLQRHSWANTYRRRVRSTWIGCSRAFARRRNRSLHRDPSDCRCHLRWNRNWEPTWLHPKWSTEPLRPHSKTFGVWARL